MFVQSHVSCCVMVAGLHNSEHWSAVPGLVHHATGLRDVLCEPVRSRPLPGATGEQQGVAPGISVCVADGKLGTPTDELQVIPHGSSATDHEVG